MSDDASKDQVFAKRLRDVKAFEFNETVANVFHDMISRSVPGYGLLLRMIGLYANIFAHPGSRVFDLGCSLGAASLIIADQTPDCDIVAVDNSPAMIDKCRQYQPVAARIDWRCEDLQQTRISNASMVILNLTLQFLQPEERLAQLQRIYRGLNPGGILVLSEKVTFHSDAENQRMIELYQAYKKTMGYSDLEISQKRNALDQVLIPDTDNTHQRRLRDIGFAEVYQCFRGFKLRLLSGNQDVIWQPVFEYLRANGQRAWAERLERQSGDWLRHHGDYPRWSAALAALPEMRDIEADFESPAVSISGCCDDSGALREALQGLIPWRKGPYQVERVHIDCEWRSNLKWERVDPQLQSLRRRRVLDVGCGNGYYAWRMLAQEPEFVLGIDPSVLFNLQFRALQKYLRRADIGLLPIGVEDLPDDLEWFDSVFSMGVLYHRKSPIDHLYQLKSLLKAGGELCLETLVIAGDHGRILLPAQRYARMRNVWFIPAAAELVRWLQRCGFSEVRVVDESITRVDEQRSTDWMRFESLAQSLDPADSTLTVEGLPAPRRAVILARKP